jgi:hypothetical protein
MNTYKITNLTNTAGKRDPKFNATLDLDYVDAMMKKTVKVKPGETIFLQISTLPLSIHRLRVKGLISVVEVGPSELKNTMEATNKLRKPKKEAVAETVEVTDEVKAVQTKKRTGKKSHGDETPDAE